jgi:hypothetical protein
MSALRNPTSLPAIKNRKNPDPEASGFIIKENNQP